MTRAPQVTAEQLYTPGEVAALFGVGTEAVAVWRKAGKIPASAVVVTPGGTHRYRAAWVDGFLAEADPWQAASP